MSKVITLKNLEVFKQECDKAYASKEEIITATVDCSHKYEITGNTGDEHGLAIEDQQMLIKKIQGHSRRKSLNLLKIDKNNFILEENTYKQTFKLKPNTNYTVSTNLEKEEKGQTRVWFNGTSTVSDGVWNGNNKTKMSSSNGELYLLIDKNSFLQLENKTSWIMFNEGTTALPFQPYDNTLVNSNNTLISTGRNILNPDEFGANCSTYDKSTGIATLIAGSEISGKVLVPGHYFVPNTSYRFIFRGKSSSSIEQYTQIRIYYTIGTYHELQFNDGLATYTSDDGKTIEKVTGTWADGTTTLYLNECAIIKGANQDFEPYKEDIIQAPSLGEFDYYQEGKIYRQTSQVVTLNGSEEWGKGQTVNSEHWRFDFVHSFSNVYENLNEVTTTSNWKDVNENQTWGGGVNNYGVSINAKRIYLCNENFTTVDQLKQWLRQNPIQLVYKLATPTIEDYTMPSGYAVYNGGLQIQQSDVPYTITKQYNLSQKAQILANIEVDREQAKMIEETNQKFNLIPKFSHVDINQPSTTTNGTLTQEQLTTLQINDLNYIIFNNEIYSLNDKTHTADTLTYSHVCFENGKHLLKTISITVSTRAWVLNTTSVVDSYEYRMFKINNPSDNISTSIKEIYIYTNKFDTASRFQDFLQNAYDGDMFFAFSCVAITPTDTIINAQFFYDLNIDPSSYFVIFNDKSEYVAHQNLVVVESA